MAFDPFGVFSAVQNFLGSFGQFFNSIKTGVAGVLHIWTNATNLKDSVLEEIDAWKNFKEDVRFKQRVINLETAIEKTRDLIQGIPEAWHSILDIIRQVKDSIAQSSPEQATSDLEEEFQSAAESGGLKGLLERFPRLARGLERAVGVIGVVFTAAEQVNNVISDLQSIVDELRRVRLEIEKLDTIFLSQSNKRKTLKLADGSTVKIRVGKLHPSA